MVVETILKMANKLSWVVDSIACKGELLDMMFHRNNFFVALFQEAKIGLLLAQIFN